MSEVKPLKIALVIPAYNEASSIGDVISAIHEHFSKSAYNPTIIVVDDGSKDNTASIASSKGAIVIRHILNAGAGSATATGLSYADQNSFDMAVTMDADGQHDPEDIIKGVTIMSRSDVDLLIGSRLINSDGMSKVKILGNKGLSYITSLLFGIRTTDSQSGLRLFSKKALSKLRWKTSGYEFCSEMLWRAKQQKLKTDEFPIRVIYTDYSKSKGQNNWNAFNIIKSLLERRIVELFSE
jgi:glycosyltransferase involved in cell wall biosynthesis